MKSLSIGYSKTDPGELNRIMLGPISSPSGSKMEIPCIIANGTEQGPTLVISGGTHGTEVVGTAAVIDVMRQLNPQRLRGAVVAVPVVNVVAFDQSSYFTPQDSGNMASPIYWRPNPNGTLTERLGALLSPLYKMADCYIDLHGNREPAAPMLMLFLSACKDRGVAERATAIGDAFGITPVDMSNPVAHPDWVGPVNDYSVPVALANGVPALMVELTRSDTVLDSQVGTRGVFNVMKYLKMIDGAPEAQSSPALPGRYRYWGALTTNHPGLVWPKIKPGVLVSPGEVIAQITNLFGDVLETIKCPAEGFVWAFHGAHYGGASHAVPIGADIGFFGEKIA
jgi:uncharacterized protein